MACYICEGKKPERSPLALDLHLELHSWWMEDFDWYSHANFCTHTTKKSVRGILVQGFWTENTFPRTENTL